MPTIAVVDRQTGQIQTLYQDEAPNQSKFGGPWGWPEHTVHLEIPSDIDPDVIATTPYTTSSGVQTFSIVVDNNLVQAKKERLWNILREERNRRLTQSDWTQVNDAPLTQEQKDQWKAYRQALRDFPSTFTEPPTTPTVDNWPLMPGQQAPSSSDMVTE